MPTSPRSLIAAARASPRRVSRWASKTSTIWWPIGNAGSRDDIGFWNTAETCTRAAPVSPSRAWQRGHGPRRGSAPPRARCPAAGRGRSAERRLAGPGLADEAEHVAPLDAQRDAADDGRPVVARRDPVDLQQRRQRSRALPRGSSQSCNPSPIRLKARTRTMIARPGAATIHAELAMKSRPSDEHQSERRRRRPDAEPDEAQRRLEQDRDSQQD